jgi:AraC-like DNA-binding protein
MSVEAIGREMTISKQIATLVSRRTNEKGNGTHATAIAPLEFMRQSATFVTMRDVSEPTLGIVLQGKKEVLLGEETYCYGVAQYLVISVDLPLYGYVTEATPEQPYLGIKLDLNAVQLCDIMSQTPPCAVAKESVRGWFISNAASSLMDCFLKLVKLLDTPQDIPFLAPLVIREIYYRLLVGEQSEAVRQIATSGSNMQNIAKAIKLIKTNFAKPIRIEDLAEQVNMSSSSLHRHFKAVTSSSPLQYQKQLRLLKARHLMLAENADAASTAYQVGYESPSQFSREYSRMFGASPIRDIERLRLV